MPLSDKINAQISQFFSDPLSWPREARSYIPRLVEQAGISVTTGQIVDAYTVATTANGLGAGVNGRLGWIRGGTTPYDYTPLVYDSVAGRWVGFPFSGGTQVQPTDDGAETGGFETTSTTEVQNTKFARLFTPHEPLDLAGLEIEMRFVTRIGISNPAQTVTAAAHLCLIDTDAGSITTVTDSGHSLTYTGSSFPAVFKDSGWIKMSVSAKDFCFPRVTLKTSNAAATARALDSVIQFRWVSD